MVFLKRITTGQTFVTSENQYSGWSQKIKDTYEIIDAKEYYEIRKQPVPAGEKKTVRAADLADLRIEAKDIKPVAKRIEPVARYTKAGKRGRPKSR